MLRLAWPLLPLCLAAACVDAPAASIPEVVQSTHDGARVVCAVRGSLTPPTRLPPAMVAEAFVSRFADVDRDELRTRAVTDERDGQTAVDLTQVVDGLRVWGARAHVVISRHGEVLQAWSQVAAATPLVPTWLGAADALRAVLRDLGLGDVTPPVRDRDRTHTRFADRLRFLDDPLVERVAYRTVGGGLAVGYAVTLTLRGEVGSRQFLVGLDGELIAGAGEERGPAVVCPPRTAVDRPSS